MENNKIKNYCRRCQYDTNHTIVYLEQKTESSPEENGYQIEYMIVECDGCESISFREDFNNYDVMYPDEFNNWCHEKKITLYPSTLRNHYGLKQVRNLPEQIRHVYEEAIEAFKAKCYLLTAVAFRTIIEAICIDKSISGKDLKNKIDNLVHARLITEKEGSRLHTIRFIGNDSVHEMAVPKQDALFLVLDIVEHLLKNLYIIDKEAKKSLVTIIETFEDFSQTLNKCVKKFKPGEEYPLVKILTKDVRLLNGKIQEFENELIQEIKEENYTKLEIGKKAKFGKGEDLVQYYRII